MNRHQAIAAQAALGHPRALTGVKVLDLTQ
jgi:hypothetical protein